MSVSIAIVPLTKSVDMYGMPDTSSAYSLSGHVSVSLKSPYSFFERRSTTRLLLQSLELTFEGQTEVVTQKLGYSAVRLCSFSRELVSNGPIELCDEGEDSAEPCVWNVVFNLAIPGWLPETACTEHSDLGLSLVSFSAMRFVAPPSDDPYFSPTTSCTIKTPNLHTHKSSIPPEVLEKVQVIVTKPEFADLRADVIAVTLRMRTNGLEANECKRLQVKEVTADIVQKEKYLTCPCKAYLSMYPVPPKERQPPNDPLLLPHPLGNMYEHELAIPPLERSESTSRTTSFLPPGEPGSYRFTKNNYAFADDAIAKDRPDWYTMEIAMPFVTERIADDALDWLTDKVELQPTVWTPLSRITHEISLSVTLSYDLDGGENQLHDRLSISVPIRLVHALPPSQTQRAPLNYTQPSTPAMRAPCLGSYTLPAYSQLYDEGGERRIDYSIPLPLYEPPSAASLVNEDTETRVKIIKPD